MRKKIRLTALLVGCLTIPLIGTCQMPYSVSKKDSIQSVISKQVSDPKVKRDLLIVLEKYPILVEENKGLTAYQKEIVAGFNTQTKIINDVVDLGVKEAFERGLVLKNNKDPIEILKDFSKGLKIANRRAKWGTGLAIGTFVGATIFSIFKN